MQNNAESKTCTCLLVDLGLEWQKNNEEGSTEWACAVCRAVRGVGPATRDRQPFLRDVEVQL